jgi:hypothetical protein
MIKLQYDDSETKITIELDGIEHSYPRLVEAFRAFSLAVGFHSNTINEYLGDTE